MPKLPNRKPKTLMKILERHGFVLDHVSGSHHIYFHPETKRRAVVPKHNRDLPPGTLHAILKEANIRRNQM